jgi:two-component system OmpR family sensor kinase
VEQLLSLARHQATAGEANLTTSVDIKQLMQTIIGEVWDSANGRQIDIGLAEADECCVLGNFDALKILFRNLLDNTIKYSTVGGVVNVAITTDGNSVLVTIDDSGHGIPTGEIERVFDRFYRVSGTKESGSGLGLAIVKAIADMHSAKISMSRSITLGGLRVVVEFPAASIGK